MFAESTSEEAGRQAGRQAANDMPDNVVPITREMSRSRRKREVRARTISLKRMPKRDLRLGRLLLHPDDFADADALRPKTRADCEGALRPCPFVGCKHNLFLDVNKETGSLKLNFPDLGPDEMPPDASCALDVADAGAHTLERVGEIMNVTRERERQVEVKALAKVRLAHGEDLRSLYVDTIDHSRDPVGNLARHMSESGGTATNVDEEPWRSGVIGGRIDEDRSWRTRVYRTYDRKLRERGLVHGPEKTARGGDAQTDEAEAEYGEVTPSRNERADRQTWTQTDADEVEDWSSDILRELLTGQPLRVALGLYPGRPLTADERARMEFRAAKEKKRLREERRAARLASDTRSGIVPPSAAPPAEACSAVSLRLPEPANDKPRIRLAVVQGGGSSRTTDRIRAHIVAREEEHMGEGKVTITETQAAVYDAVKALLAKGYETITNAAISAQAKAPGSVGTALARLQREGLVTWTTEGAGRGAVRSFAVHEKPFDVGRGQTRTGGTAKPETKTVPRARPEARPTRPTRSAPHAPSPSSEDRLMRDMRARREAVVAEYESKLAKIDAAIEAFA